MSIGPNNATDEAETLQGDVSVFRGIRKTWRDAHTGQLLAVAFIRRLNLDNDGLSINTTREEALNALKKLAGTVRLEVHRIRELELDVNLSTATYGNINTSIPYPEHNRDRAEHLANELVKRSQDFQPR